MSHRISIALILLTLIGLLVAPMPARAVPSQQTQIPDAEYQALIAFYNSTDGPNWTNKTGWLQTDTPCSWYGVSCANGRVTRLSLYHNNLTGSIPSQIADLASLIELWLPVNQLRGTIPPTLGNFAGLTELNLGGNQLTGTIPPELGSLAALRGLSLGGNRLTGTIPPELGNLANLESLILFGNQLTGTIPPELGKLANLEGLALEGNQLTGTIPPELGNLANLSELRLGGNRLTGTIPPELGLTRLWWLDLVYNQLTGALPFELGSLAELTSLEIRGCPLSGPLPRSLMNLALEDFHFDDTNLCEPGDDAFQAWLSSIPHLSRTGVICSSPEGLSISHIEVTQAIQDEGNNVPLIAGKPTFVRVYVDCGEGCTSREVTGRLYAYGSSGELAGSPLTKRGTVTHEAWTSQRADLRKSLNYTLPPEWLSGTITLVAEVEEATRSRECSFQQAKPVRVIYVPIRHDGSEPDSARIRHAFHWASRVYPTAQIDYVAGPTMTWHGCTGSGGTCIWPLTTYLTTWYRLGNGYGSSDAYVFGWLPTQDEVYGFADARLPTWPGLGRAAIAVENGADWDARAFAHEIGHLLGRGGIDMSDCTSGDALKDWPWDDARIHDFGLDGYGFAWLLGSSGAIKPPLGTYDYMSYCPRGGPYTGSVWTSRWTYEHIFTETLRVSTAGQAPHVLSSAQAYFIGSGLVYSAGTATLDPVLVTTLTAEPENPPVGTQYCLEAQDASGIPLAARCFDLSFIDHLTGLPAEAEGFNLMLPYPAGVGRIVLKKGDQELAERVVSSSAPVVSVISPNGGETWPASGSQTITWTAEDADGDALTYSVLFSPDGSSWLPLGAGITETQLSVNVAELAGGSEAKVRVLATDGVNTTTDDSDAAFTIASKPPQVFILSPEAGVTIAAGTPLWLNGYAHDLEDGTLGETALRWTSDVQGSLGTGSQVLADLQPGNHIIALHATDGDRNEATAQVNVSVVYEVELSVGWNLISLPLEPANPAPGDVLSSITGKYDLVYGLDAAGAWQRYVPGAGDNDLAAMHWGHGYWIHATEEATLTVTGTMPVSPGIPLRTGWNLVGYPGQEADSVADALELIDGKYDLVYAYDLARAGEPWQKHNPALPAPLNDLTTMAPGRGYWIHATEECTWTVP